MTVWSSFLIGMKFQAKYYSHWWQLFCSFPVGGGFTRSIPCIHGGAYTAKKTLFALQGGLHTTQISSKSDARIYNCLLVLF